MQSNDQFRQYQSYANGRAMNHAPSATSATSGFVIPQNPSPQVNNKPDQASILISLLGQLHQL